MQQNSKSALEKFMDSVDGLSTDKKGKLLGGFRLANNSGNCINSNKCDNVTNGGDCINSGSCTDAKNTGNCLVTDAFSFRMS